MNSTIPEPIYQQVGAALRNLIHSDKFQSGDRFLGEREVAEQFNISRITANKAIAALVSEGLLEYRRGIGNFVRPPVMGYDFRGLFSFTKKARSEGFEPSTQVLQFKRQSLLDSDELLPGLLEALTDEEVFVIERVRCVNDKPVILERRSVRAIRCPELTEEDARGSLYAAFNRFGLPLTGNRATLRAVSLAEREAHLLACREGAAAFLISAVGYSGDSLWYEETLYRGDSYEVRHVLGEMSDLVTIRNEI